MEKETIPDTVKDVLSTLHENHVSLHKYLSIIKDYLIEEPIKNCNNLINYICDHVYSNEVENSLSSYLEELVEQIQAANEKDVVEKKPIHENDQNEKNDEDTSKKKNDDKITEEKNGENSENICDGGDNDGDDELFCSEYRIHIKNEKLNKYKVPDFQKSLMENYIKNVNYLKLLYTISNKVLPKNGYVLFLNIFHGCKINYRYKLVALEYFANCANRIKTNRAKYVAQILPTILEKFYSIDGEPYYNDNINDVDLLIGVSRFVAVLCDESINQQEDDQQDVALYSIVAFIMRIVYYHSSFLPLNKNVEQLFKYINYTDINYEECINIYRYLDRGLYTAGKERIIKQCLSSLIWKLSVINPNLPKTLEKVNILIPNTETCVLENSTLELSVVSYLILIQKINTEAFPLVYSELYLLNLMLRNSFNLILCVPIAKEHKRLKLLLRAYHFIAIAAVLSKVIEKTQKEVFSNIYKFNWRPLDFLTKIYQTLQEYNGFQNHTHVIYNCISNIMRNFQWDIFFNLYFKLICNCENDLVRGTVAAFFKDELFKHLCSVLQKVEDLQKEKDLKQQKENNEESEKCKIKEEVIALIDKTGKQIKKVVCTMLNGECVNLYLSSITVALNILKMILLNKRFEPFYQYIVDLENSSKCFVQNKLQYFLDQIKIERQVLQNKCQSEKSISTADSVSEYNSNVNNNTNSANFNDVFYKKMDNNAINDATENQLCIITFLLEDVEKAIQQIKLKEAPKIKP